MKPLASGAGSAALSPIISIHAVLVISVWPLARTQTARLSARYVPDS
ncbi:hypothetical protein [Phage blackswan219-1]|nr:hypothetical protein [Phage blackswan219-1]